MAKICIISGLHLSTNPRVWKEAKSLAEAGYDVRILTNWVSETKLIADKRFIAHHNIQYLAATNLIPGQVGELKRFCYRLRKRIAVEAKKIFSSESSWLLLFAPGVMRQKAMAINADLYICHTEAGILVGKYLIEKGRNVAFDIEDWYSRDYLVPSRPVKMLKKLEYFALNHGKYCSCPSNAMANALAEVYRATQKPLVVYNGFSVSEQDTINLNEPVKPFTLVWFSQVIGPGRGLESVIECLHLLDIGIELHLIGQCVPGYEEVLRMQFPSGGMHLLIIHPPVMHVDLLRAISQYEIGLAIENDVPDNKDKTISNKILQYVQAGIKILATNTAGQREVAAYFPQQVRIVEVNDIKGYVQSLKELLNSKTDRAKQISDFSSHFSWEAQEAKLIELIKKAVG